MAASVHDNSARLRYEINVDGRVVGHVTYHRHGDTITFVHTEVVPDVRDGGYAKELVQCALDDVRARGLRVVARCTYVARFIGKHPEYADLLAA